MRDFLVGYGWRMRIIMVIGLLIELFWGKALWAQSLPVVLSEKMRAHKVVPEEVAIWVQAVDAQYPLVAFNGNTLLNPASVAKLLTTGAALLSLGGEYRWQTRFYLDQLPDADGVVNGNLYVKGAGDLSLLSSDLRNMLQAMRAQGLRHIQGNIVLDNTRFSLSASERDAFAFDGAGVAAYNAIPDALMIEQRLVKLHFVPKAKGVEIHLMPNVASWTVNNQVRLVSGACNKNSFSVRPSMMRQITGLAELTIEGVYSPACGEQTIEVALGESSELFYYWFRQLWYELGGSFAGGGEIAPVPEGAVLFYSGQTRSLREQMIRINQDSNNVMARQLLLNIGAVERGEPASLHSGRQAALRVLQDAGMSMEGVVLDNGAGLSRQTRISAKQLAELLRYFFYAEQSIRRDFIDSLARVGEVGTLRKRALGEALVGRVWGKTGTIKGVRAFAGYVEAESGRVYLVVVMGNGRSAVGSRALQDDVLRWVYAQ